MRAALLFLLLLVIPAVHSVVLVNSQDWRDVYTGMQYAGVTGEQGFFVVDSTQGADLATRVPQEPVLLITGRDQAMPSFKQLLTSRGYQITDFRSSDALATNQEFALRAPTKNIIVVDDAYGYNAMSVGTYAKMRNASVLFADPGVLDIIDEKQPQELLLYGHIPSTLLEQLSQYNPESINEQDKFEDNFALVKRFTQQDPKQTVLLTNGEFIETQLLMDETPVLFIGRQNVPEQVIDFLKEENFRISVLIGNALAPNARFIKDETGMSLFIKFAQGRNQEQFALDLFPIPIPNPLITVTQAEYDPVQQALLVTYQNPGEISTYFTGSFTGTQGTVEDDVPVFLEAGSYKTVSYSMPPPPENIAYTVLYGASPLALEFIVQGAVDVTQVTVRDESEIIVTAAQYDQKNERFLITLENTKTTDAYALAELVDVRIGSELVRIGAPVTRVRAQSEAVVEVPATLTDRDIQRNQELVIETFYGSREFSLVKFSRVTLAFTLAEGSLPWTWILIVGAIAIVLVWFVSRKEKKKRW